MLVNINKYSIVAVYVLSFMTGNASSAKQGYHGDSALQYIHCHFHVLQPGAARAPPVQPLPTTASCIVSFCAYVLSQLQYTRFRRGKCHFEVAGPELSWQHNVAFDTYPKGTSKFPN